MDVLINHFDMGTIWSLYFSVLVCQSSQPVRNWPDAWELSWEIFKLVFLQKSQVTAACPTYIPRSPCCMPKPWGRGNSPFIIAVEGYIVRGSKSLVDLWRSSQFWGVCVNLLCCRDRKVGQNPKNRCVLSITGVHGWPKSKGKWQSFWKAAENWPVLGSWSQRSGDIYTSHGILFGQNVLRKAIQASPQRTEKEMEQQQASWCKSWDNIGRVLESKPSCWL